MTEKDYIFELMYRAFLDIRVASYERDRHICFVLADVFHNVPLQMKRADKGEKSYTEIVAWIQERCVQRNCQLWLDGVTADIMKQAH